MTSLEFREWVKSLPAKGKNLRASEILGVSISTIERYSRGYGRGSKISRQSQLIIKCRKEMKILFSQ